MSEIYLGKPGEKIAAWCKAKYPPAPAGTPYIYAGTSGGAHEHKFEVTTLSGKVDLDEDEQIGILTCKVNGETVNNKDITYLSADGGCKCTSVGSDAFYECDSLSSVSLPTATSIGNLAFSWCDSLSSVSLPAATSIGVEAFCGCSLTSVSLPAATSIGEAAFNMCLSLTSVSLPAATSIGNSAFQSCKSLTSISLPAATRINSAAFMYCESLSSVSLPVTTRIEEMVFSECPNLTLLELDSMTQAEVEANAYDNWDCQTSKPITVKCILTATGQVGTFVLQAS